MLMPGFQHYVAVSVAVSVTVSVKTVSVPAVPYAVAGACSAAGPVGRPVSFSCKRVGEAPGVLPTGATAKRKNRTRSYINGSTATANLRKRRTLFFYESYIILTDERNSYVLLKRSTEIRLRRNGYVTLETRHNALCVKISSLQLLKQDYITRNLGLTLIKYGHLPGRI